MQQSRGSGRLLVRGCGAEEPRHSDRHFTHWAIFLGCAKRRGVMEAKAFVTVGAAFLSLPPCARPFDQGREVQYVEL
jgi:hypothetical protein